MVYDIDVVVNLDSVFLVRVTMDFHADVKLLLVYLVSPQFWVMYLQVYILWCYIAFLYV